MSILGVCWGGLAECDLNSEKLRRLGVLRTYLWTAMRIVRPVHYPGSVSYLPLGTDPATGRPVAPARDDEPVRMPPLLEPVPDDWVTEEGPFLNVYAVNQVRFPSPLPISFSFTPLTF